MKKICNSLYQLTDILNDGQYHDGDSIGAAIGISRSAVWKLIKKLVEYGVEIHSLKGKGYQLKEPLQLLNAEQIAQQLKQPILIDVLETIASTNDYLKQQRKHPKNQIQACLAETQTAGRGRLNRDWHSPFGKNIYLSCLYPLQKDMSELAGLSLVVGLAVFRVLQTYANQHSLGVKWPNDILCDNKKLAGILIDVQAESHGQCMATIGIGVNVNMLQDENYITQPWISLRALHQKLIDRNQLSAALLNELLRTLKLFEAHGFHHFLNEWLEHDVLQGQDIALKNVDHVVRGKVVGVNEQAHLMLELSDGTIRAFSSGEVSVVKNP